MIDDDEITCPLPSAGCARSALNLAYFHSLIRIAQASSKIEKRLSAVRCSRFGPASTIEAVQQLNTELLRVKITLDDSFSLSLGKQIDITQLPGSLNLEQYLYIQYAYLTAMLSIHSVLAYPWVRALVGVRSGDQFREAVLRSVNASAQTARAAVLLTESIQFKAHTSVPWVQDCPRMLS
jgi:hypothetical protein